MGNSLSAGTATADISPPEGLRLRGYPHYPRYNTGIHDPLYASCLVLDDGRTPLALVALDLVMYPNKDTWAVRRAVASRCAIPAANIMICSSHTHSGPWTSRGISVDALEEDIRPDPGYVEFLRERLVSLILEAEGNRFPARVGVDKGVCGRERGVGGNRRDPDGPADPEVWTIGVQDADGHWRACAVKYALHPTVLHAENTLVSADYPGYIRQYLNKGHPGMTFLFLQGTSGNQSSRYFRSAQTFEEAERIGHAIAAEAQRVLSRMELSAEIPLKTASTTVEIDLRQLPDLEQAEALVREKRRELEEVQASGAAYADVQTADLHLLGAEDILTFVKHLAKGGSIEALSEEIPAEVQVFGIGDARLVGLSGEIFVEYGLQIMERSPASKTFVVELANGRLPGYVCTEEAYAQGGYEAGASLMTAKAGQTIVDAALELLHRLPGQSA